MKVIPLKGNFPISSTYKDHTERRPPSNAPGIDFAAPSGTLVLAPAAGRVLGLYNRKLGGMSFFVDHDNGWLTYYAHLQSVWALTGQKVEAGQTIGTVGKSGSATGPHLHWGLQRSETGAWIDPFSVESPFGEVAESPVLVLDPPGKPVLYGMHDRGGEHLMIDSLSEGKRGWILITEAIGTHANNDSGGSYDDLSAQGFKVIVRLNHGYGTKGTLPESSLYGDFAKRCGNFVLASTGCQRWIIGNEPNLAWERPGGPGGEKIMPEMYARAFLLCRAEIRRRQAGHLVFPAAVGPWNVQTGDWINYFRVMLKRIGGQLDGITLHTYTHGSDPSFIYSDLKMATPGYEARYWHFKAYQDFMQVIPESLRSLPCLITETDQYGPWLDQNTGWVHNAYQEIRGWNKVAGNQTITALILYRWVIGNPHDPRDVGWAISDKHGVQDDFQAAMDF